MELGEIEGKRIALLIWNTERRMTHIYFRAKLSDKSRTSFLKIKRWDGK
jgi:hypothetical protein